jgi:anaerobic selenocysteine-containing dehydrogenase
MMKKVVKTLCQMCYFYCGLDVTVEDGRILKIEGSRENPSNKGRLCAKGLASAQIVTDPNRLKTPLKRVGERGAGKWERISWDQALDEIAEKLFSIRDEFGPEYLGYFWNQAPGWYTSFRWMWRFMNAWGSPNIFSQGHLCYVPRALAHNITFGSPPEPDYEHTACMMLIGYNPVYTSPVNYGARVIGAKQRGAKLIVIDPRFTNTASKANLYLQPRPGTDGALILGMIQVIIAEGLYDAEFIDKWTIGFKRLKEFVQNYAPEKVEPITWVKADKIREAARLIAKIKPAVVVDGNGLDMHTNGFQAVRATSILRALIRTVDEPGGGVLMPKLPEIDVKRRGIPSLENLGRGSKFPGFEQKAVSSLYMSEKGGWGLQGVELIDSLATQKPFGIKAVIIQGVNPVASLTDPNHTRQALKKLDLLVHHDLFMNTATGQIADILLPAASFLERDLKLFYRYRIRADRELIAMQNQCVSPVGESKSDLDFIFALARRVGLEQYFPWENVTDAFDWELEANNTNVAWLREHPEGYMVKYTADELYRKYEHDGFATPSKKIEFFSATLEENGFAALPAFIEPAISPISKPDLAKEYPLVCSIALKLGIHTHTQFRTLPWIREIEPDPFAEIHPDTASELGIQDRDWIMVESPEGSIRVRARVRYTMHPRVLTVTFGYGEPYAGDNDLTGLIASEKERDTVTGSTGNRSFLCKVRKAED